MYVLWNNAGCTTISAAYNVIYDWFTKSIEVMRIMRAGVLSTMTIDMDASSRPVLLSNKELSVWCVISNRLPSLEVRQLTRGLTFRENKQTETTFFFFCNFSSRTF